MHQTDHKQEFIEMVTLNKGIIYKICNSYCDNKEDREDLAQEIIYNLWKAYQRYEPASKFTTWMYRIALNVAISFYRKESRSIVQSTFDESIIVFDNNDNQDDEHVQLLFSFISQLKEMDRSIILLYLEDKSYKDIADITGISHTNVATKINRIKQSLKNSFYNLSK